MQQSEGGVTARQQQVLDFVQRFIAEQGMPPTRLEISEHFGFSSCNAAEEHLKALSRQGALILTPGIARGIQLPQPSGVP